MRYKDLIYLGTSRILSNKIRVILTSINIAIGTAMMIVFISFGYNLVNLTRTEMNSNAGLNQINIYALKNDKMQIVRTPFTEDTLNCITTYSNNKQIRMTYYSNNCIAEVNSPITGLPCKIPVTITNVTEMKSFLINSDVKAISKDKSPFLAGSGYKSNNGIIVSEVFISQLKLKPKNALGQKIKLLIKGKELTAVITGILSKDVSMYFDSNYYGEIFIPYYLVPDLTAGSISSITIESKNTKDISSIVKHINVLGYKTATHYEEAVKFSSTVYLIFVGCIVLGVILFIITSLGIINTMKMSIKERIKFYGLLKAIGTQNKTIKKIIFVEAALIGFIGSFFGAILILVIKNIALNFYKHEDYYFKISSLLKMPVFIVVVNIIIAIIICIFCTRKSAVYVTKEDIITSLRFDT